MNHNEVAQQQSSVELSSLESDSKNYKSLFEEIAQNNTKIYLNDSTISNDISRYVDSSSSESQCCCCKVHRRHSSFVSTGNSNNAVAKPFHIPIYNTIWIGEMKNATDYIEYLNETRRNSFNSLNKDNRSNYYKLMLTDLNSKANSRSRMNDDDDVLMTKNNNHNHTNQFLQVPKINTNDEQMRRTPEFEDISKKIDQIHSLDSSVSTLIYKSIEVHADILSLDATVSRLLAETRKLLEELEDVKCLDDIIEMLNTEIPIIHREWMYPVTNLNKIPIDEGIIVSL